MNKKGIGELTEASILPRLLARGWSVSIPFGNNQRYDFIVDDGSRLHRVQCKTAWTADGSVVFSACSKNGFTGKRKNYHGQVECFLVYHPPTGKLYAVPVGATRNTDVFLRVAPFASGGDRLGVKWARHFEFGDSTRLDAIYERPSRAEKKILGPSSAKVVAWPDDATLRALVWKLTARGLAKELGVSGAAVRKRCKGRGIETPPRGYWAKATARQRQVEIHSGNGARAAHLSHKQAIA